jgi:hypothetical protein
MSRLTAGIIGLRGIGVLVGPVFAQQQMMGECDKWVKAIDTEVAQRFDPASAEAKVKATEIADMC